MPKVKKPTTPDDLSSLKQRCEVLELDNAILQETIDILKKDPGADPRDLSNREKSQVIGALKMKTHYPVQNPLQRGESFPIQLILLSEANSETGSPCACTGEDQTTI